MKELERECKVTLFERRNNSLYITDAGVLFLREAKKMQRQYESMEVAVKTLSEGREFVRIVLRLCLEMPYTRNCGECSASSIRK